MKKILSMALLICLCVAFLVPANVFASNISITIDGVEKTMSTPVVIVEGRSLVAAEEFFAAMGAKYTYYENDEIVFAENEDYTVEFILGDKVARGTRRNYDLDVAAQMIDGKVMVPVRFVAEKMGYKVGWIDATSSVTIDKIKYTSAVPENESVKEALARGRRLTEFRFTPLNPIPMDSDSKIFKVNALNVDENGNKWFEAGKEYKGIPYSSTEQNNKFLCENVSFETYMTALANPDSALYTKDMFHSSNASAYFGMVCNAFVRYSLGIEERYNTALWPRIPGMNFMFGPMEYRVNDLKLCDVLHKDGHVAMVTNLLYNEAGKIERVEVSESMTPTCRRRIFTLDEFYTSYGDIYSIYRYENLDKAPAFDPEQDEILASGLDKVAPMIAVDYGNKSNYIEGEETVISVFAEGENTVQIICNDKVVEEIPVNGYTKITRKLPKGYYVVKLANTEYSNEFAVCYPVISHSIDDKKLTIKAESGDPQSELIHMEFRSSSTTSPVSAIKEHIFLTAEELASGTATRPIPANVGYYKVYFRNKYGIWTLDRLEIK